MSAPRVVALRDYAVMTSGGRFVLRYELPADVVQVDRRTPYGNPFRIGDPWHGRPMTREDAIARFRLYAEARLLEEPHWLDPLVGMTLACHCAPKRCHAEVLLELANRVVVPHG